MKDERLYRCIFPPFGQRTNEMYVTESRLKEMTCESLQPDGHHFMVLETRTFVYGISDAEGTVRVGQSDAGCARDLWESFEGQGFTVHYVLPATKPFTRWTASSLGCLSLPIIVGLVVLIIFQIL